MKSRLIKKFDQKYFWHTAHLIIFEGEFLWRSIYGFLKIYGCKRTFEVK